MDDEDLLIGIVRGSDERRVLERVGLRLIRGVLCHRYLLALTCKAEVSLAGESSEISKSESSALASFPLSVVAAVMASRGGDCAAVVIVSTGCATMFPWECA